MTQLIQKSARSIFLHISAQMTNDNKCVIKSSLKQYKNT